MTPMVQGFREENRRGGDHSPPPPPARLPELRAARRATAGASSTSARARAARRASFPACSPPPLLSGPRLSLGPARISERGAWAWYPPRCPGRGPPAPGRPGSPALRCWYQTPPRARPRGPDHRLPATPDPTRPQGRRLPVRPGRGRRGGSLGGRRLRGGFEEGRPGAPGGRRRCGPHGPESRRQGPRCPGERPGPAASEPGASVGQQPHPHSAP